MDKASDFESEGCGFESHRGSFTFLEMSNRCLNKSTGILHIQPTTIKEILLESKVKQESLLTKYKYSFTLD